MSSTTTVSDVDTVFVGYPTPAWRLTSFVAPCTCGTRPERCVHDLVADFDSSRAVLERRPPHVVYYENHAVVTEAVDVDVDAGAEDRDADAAFMAYLRHMETTYALWKCVRGRGRGRGRGLRLTRPAPSFAWVASLLCAEQPISSPALVHEVLCATSTAAVAVLAEIISIRLDRWVARETGDYVHRLMYTCTVCVSHLAELESSFLESRVPELARPVEEHGSHSLDVLTALTCVPILLRRVLSSLVGTDASTLPLDDVRHMTIAILSLTAPNCADDSVGPGPAPAAADPRPFRGWIRSCSRLFREVSNSFLAVARAQELLKPQNLLEARNASSALEYAAQVFPAVADIIPDFRGAVIEAANKAVAISSFSTETFPELGSVPGLDAGLDVGAASSRDRGTVLSTVDSELVATGCSSLYRSRVSALLKMELAGSVLDLAPTRERVHERECAVVTPARHEHERAASPGSLASFLTHSE